MTSAQLAAMLHGGGISGSGTSVTWATALQVTTVLSCAKVLAEGVAQVPWKVFQSGGARTEASGHWLHDLIYRTPMPGCDSFSFRETLMFHVVLTGNAFVQKLRVGSQRKVAALALCEPQRIRVSRDDQGRLRYFHTPENGSELEIAAEDMWHVRGPSWNSWMGLEAVKLAREAIGLAMATESQHASMHRNGMQTNGAYSVEGTLTSTQYDGLSSWMDRYAQGGDRQGKPMILDRGAKFLQMQMSGVDAQHIETRALQIEEICRAFRVMPIMVGHPDKTATYASAEQMFLAHVVHTLMPWYVRLEQSADANLLTEADRAAGFYTKFNPNALMRGAAKDRGEFYAKALGAGGQPAWMTQDDVRALEEMDPMGGAAAELNPGSMGAATRSPGAQAGG